MSAAAPFKIDSEAMLTLKSLWIKDSSSAANGGADYNEGTGNIITSPLSGNTAGAAGTSGGTIYNAADNVTVVNSPLSGNTANAAGGAIDNNGCSLQTASSRQTRVQEMPEDILKAFFAGHSECSMGPVGDLTRPQVRGVSMDGGKVNIWKKLNFHCVADLILFAIR